MENLKFRKLTAEDIDIRIGQKSDKITMFLLYKNARVDMNILDETVGQDRWHRDHKELKGNLFCGVGIEVTPGKIVWKWDCGTESNTEKEKGEASDSFKRACVNWGIGRELYTTPRVKIANEKLRWSERGTLITPLAVSYIAYDDAGKITDLTIIDGDDLAEVWKMQGGTITLGIGAKTSRRAAQKPQADKVPAQEDKPAETAVKTKLTGALVKAGRCTKILQYLSAFDPDDFIEYNKGLKAVEAKYDITTDGYSALDLAVREIRKKVAANA